MHSGEACLSRHCTFLRIRRRDPLHIPSLASGASKTKVLAGPFCVTFSPEIWGPAQVRNILFQAFLQLLLNVQNQWKLGEEKKPFGCFKRNIQISSCHVLPFGRSVILNSKFAPKFLFIGRNDFLELHFLKTTIMKKNLALYVSYCQDCAGFKFFVVFA